MKLPVDYEELTPTQRREVREEYVRLQSGKCSHCGEPLFKKTTIAEDYPINRRLFPVGFFKNPVHLHHDHDTGDTIGAVHAHCNAILWQFFGE